jgi:hypothetical protein
LIDESLVATQCRPEASQQAVDSLDFLASGSSVECCEQTQPTCHTILQQPR